MVKVIYRLLWIGIRLVRWIAGCVLMNLLIVEGICSNIAVKLVSVTGWV